MRSRTIFGASILNEVISLRSPALVARARMASAGLIGVSMAGAAILCRGVYKIAKHAKDSGALKRMLIRGDKLHSMYGFDSKMSKKEAGLILNLATNAELDKIKHAHRVLMSINHPDKGGSEYIATKINEAKEALLKKD